MNDAILQARRDYTADRLRAMRYRLETLAADIAAALATGGSDCVCDRIELYACQTVSDWTAWRDQINPQAKRRDALAEQFNIEQTHRRIDAALERTIR